MVDWRRKHLGALEANYKKARFFEPIFQGLKTFIMHMIGVTYTGLTFGCLNGCCLFLNWRRK
ncbi:MAG: hypothetical protein DRG83_13510 [Deltaproteobacteria bacterium]|nr:MAG: hypothetical protein DRG83_13510 [Deltaproteobacteria bacterium]